MSNTKTVMSQAANTLVKPLEVEDVFSTYVYTGNNDNAGNTQTITNGIDLDGEGGLVWIKNRTGASNHILMDTERGVNNALETNDTAGTRVYSGDSAVVTSFNSNGFGLGEGSQGNYLNSDYASWTFRKAPKFFDVVTYTGDGTSSQTINHNLGTTVGSIIVKRTDSTGEWNVFHRALTSAPETRALYLNQTSSYGTGPAWASTMPTSTSFTVGSTATTNISGATYVAYLFAHNDGDGGFNGGDIIKCGSYTGGTDGTTFVDLGWEPQWLLLKKSSGSSGWALIDNMRGLPAVGGSSDINRLTAESSSAEVSGGNNGAKISSTGFYPWGNGGGDWNTSGQTYIYIAIRRGTKVPESGTEVFDVFNTTNAQPAGVYGSVGPVDLNVNKKSDITYSWRVFDRLRNDYQLNFDNTNADNARDWVDFDEMDGIYINSTGSSYLLSDSQVHYNWKRAPGFFDVVAYTGDGVAGRTVSHNLTVAPEMMWVKCRNAVTNWFVYHADEGATERGFLDGTNAFSSFTGAWNNTAPTDSVFSVGTGGQVNTSGNNYIAYLFASLPGISKVGSYTGNGTSQTIDCGFTSGARFVMIKRTSGAQNWYVFDSERGITSGADKALFLNTTDAEDTYTGADIDPVSSGFVLDGAGAGINESGETYIFYAIA